MKSDLLEILESGYSKRSWHGPNLRRALRGVGPAEAAWRPAPGRHNIWEIVIHLAYWKYAVHRRLSGAKRGSFAVTGSNWFPRPAAETEAAWKGDLQLLESEHEDLFRFVGTFSDADLVKAAPGHDRTWRVAQVVYGVAFHDIYHAGQIQLIRKLRAGAGTP
jgi:hypothetical protein